MTFKQEFFKIYDRKVNAGEIIFSKLGIKKEDFTRLCTEEGYSLDDETMERIVITMKLTEEEKKILYGAQKDV